MIIKILAIIALIMGTLIFLALGTFLTYGFFKVVKFALKLMGIYIYYKTYKEFDRKVIKNLKKIKYLKK